VNKYSKGSVGFFVLFCRKLKDPKNKELRVATVEKSIKKVQCMQDRVGQNPKREC
jgi:hypothetical protein